MAPIRRELLLCVRAISAVSVGAGDAADLMVEIALPSERITRGDGSGHRSGLGWPCPRIPAIIADLKSVHATYAAYMQPCDRHDPSVPERQRTADGPVSEEKWLFGEFGERPRTVANVDYC